MPLAMRSLPSTTWKRSSLNTPNGVNLLRLSAWMKRRNAIALSWLADSPYSMVYATSITCRSSAPAPRDTRYWSSGIRSRLRSNSLKLSAVG